MSTHVRSYLWYVIEEWQTMKSYDKQKYIGLNLICYDGAITILPVNMVDITK